ncbi:MAG: extracellular solute-binding protein [Geminicoccaceae bacterium]
MAATWADRPPSDVDLLNFVVWTYGDIYSQLATRFEDDWGVPVESVISSFNDHPAKLMTMFASGDYIDVSQSSPFSFPNFIQQGLVEPLDGLPGIEEYVADFSPFIKQVAVQDGQVMGLPYFSAIWVWNYYEDLLEQAGLEPFQDYDG